jgi:hypothetical protein
MVERSSEQMSEVRHAMTVQPPICAFLALWNDVDPACIPEYEAWHQQEHVPERVSVPGVLSGTRYESDRADQQRYFTLYELTSLTCLESQPYRQLVEQPTPWSVRMRPAFRNFQRLTCQACTIAGDEIGNGVAVERVVWHPAVAPSVADLGKLTRLVSHREFKLPLSRILIGLSRAAGPQALLNVDDAPEGIEAVFVLQSIGEAELSDISEHFRRHISASLQAPAWQRSSIYHRISHIAHRPVSGQERPSPRSDLMKAWEKRHFA